MKNVRLLFITDKAVATSGPHRRVVECLNAVTLLADVSVTLLAKEIDPHEPFASRLDKHVSGYDPHNPLNVLRNLSILRAETKNCDLMYVSTGLKNFLYAWLFRTKKRKLVAGPDITPIPLISPPMDPNYIMTVKMVDTWIEASEQRAAYTISGGANREEFVVLRSSIDLEAFSPEKADPHFWRRLNLDPHRHKLILVAAQIEFPVPGSLENRKGSHVLLEAFEILSPDFPDWDLVLIGRPSERYLRKYGQMSNTYFVGPLWGDDLAIAYASASLACLPSLYESYCYVGAEMFASGIPVVSSRVGVMPELIEDGVSGIFFDISPRLGAEPHPDAAQRLAQSLRPLMADPDARRTLGRNARSQALTKLSREVFAERLGAVLRAVLDGRRTPWPLQSNSQGGDTVTACAE